MPSSLYQRTYRTRKARDSSPAAHDGQIRWHDRIAGKTNYLKNTETDKPKMAAAKKKTAGKPPAKLVHKSCCGRDAAVRIINNVDLTRTDLCDVRMKDNKGPTRTDVCADLGAGTPARDGLSEDKAALILLSFAKGADEATNDTDSTVRPLRTDSMQKRLEDNYTGMPINELYHRQVALQERLKKNRRGIRNRSFGGRLRAMNQVPFLNQHLRAVNKVFDKAFDRLVILAKMRKSRLSQCETTCLGDDELIHNA